MALQATAKSLVCFVGFFTGVKSWILTPYGCAGIKRSLTAPRERGTFSTTPRPPLTTLKMMPEEERAAAQAMVALLENSIANQEEKLRLLEELNQELRRLIQENQHQIQAALERSQRESYGDYSGLSHQQYSGSEAVADYQEGRPAWDVAPADTSMASTHNVIMEGNPQQYDVTMMEARDEEIEETQETDSQGKPILSKAYYQYTELARRVRPQQPPINPGLPATASEIILAALQRTNPALVADLQRLAVDSKLLISSMLPVVFESGLSIGDFTFVGTELFGADGLFDHSQVSGDYHGWL